MGKRLNIIKIVNALILYDKARRLLRKIHLTHLHINRTAALGGKKNIFHPFRLFFLPRRRFIILFHRIKKSYPQVDSKTPATNRRSKEGRKAAFKPIRRAARPRKG